MTLPPSSSRRTCTWRALPCVWVSGVLPECPPSSSDCDGAAVRLGERRFHGQAGRARLLVCGPGYPTPDESAQRGRRHSHSDDLVCSLCSLCDSLFVGPDHQLSGHGAVTMSHMVAARAACHACDARRHGDCSVAHARTRWELASARPGSGRALQVRTGGRYLVLDSACGLVVAAIAQQLCGDGQAPRAAHTTRARSPAPGLQRLACFVHAGGVTHPPMGWHALCKPDLR